MASVTYTDREAAAYEDGYQTALKDIEAAKTNVQKMRQQAKGCRPAGTENQGQNKMIDDGIKNLGGFLIDKECPPSIIIDFVTILKALYLRRS